MKVTNMTRIQSRRQSTMAGERPNNMLGIMRYLIIVLVWSCFSLACVEQATAGMAGGRNFLYNSQNQTNGVWGSVAVTAVRDSVAAFETLTQLHDTSPNYAIAVFGLSAMPTRNNDELARQTWALAIAGQDVSTAVSQLLSVQNPMTSSPVSLGFPGSGWGLASGFSDSPIDTALVLRALKAGGTPMGLSIVQESIGAGQSSAAHSFVVPSGSSNLTLFVRGTTGNMRFWLTRPNSSRSYVDITPGGTPVNVTFSSADAGTWGLSVTNTSSGTAIYSAEVFFTTQSGLDVSRLTAAWTFLGLTQNTDGGWGLAPGGDSHLMITYEVMKTLAGYGDLFASALTKAATWLASNKKNADGGFSSEPNMSNVQETALAISAVRLSNSAVSLDDSVAYVANAQLPNGSWQNDPYLTALSMQAIEQPPVAICQAQIVVSPGTGCQAVVTGYMVDGGSTGTISNEYLTPAGPFGIGTNSVTLTVEGPRGSSICGNALVIVQDTTPPTITAPPDKILNTDPGQCYATGVALGSPVTSDNCGIARAVNDAPVQFPKGTNTVIWTVTDTSGNAATATQQVIVSDIEVPVFTGPSNIVAGTDAGQCSKSNLIFTTTFTDNCPGVMTDCTPPSGTTFPKGLTTVSCTAIDAAGNVASSTFTVTINDTGLPTILAPADKTVNTDPGQCYATGVVLGSPVTGDNCGVAAVTNNAPLQFLKGTNTVTWTVTDTSGNTATALQKVVAQDAEPPVITCPGNIMTSTDSGQSTKSNLTFTATASDNCAGVTVGCTPPSGATFPVGTNTVLCTATDTSGNSTNCSFAVVVTQCLATITTSVSPAGSGTVSPDTVTTNCGTTITLAATPAPCYGLVNWTENGVVIGSNLNCTVSANSDRSLVANFSSVSNTISTSSSPPGGGATSGGGTVACGSTVTVTATPTNGYTFVNWTDSGTGVSTLASYTFTAAGNCSLVANFAGLTITTTSPLPTGTVGIVSSNLFHASGGFPAYKWSVRSGHPPEGLKLNATSGLLSGKPTVAGTSTFRVRVTDSKDQFAEKDFTLVMRDVFGPLAGTYNGLIIQTITPTFANSGSIKLVLSKTGSFAANLSLGGVATAYRGQFDAAGNATNSVTPRGAPTLRIPLHLDVTSVSGQIVGTVAGGAANASLLADLAVYSTRNPCLFAGKYNCLLEPTTNSPTIPHGDGYATFTVTTSGSGALAGTLADGTALSLTMPVSKQRTWPLYKLLYTSKGASIGWLSISSSNTVTAVVDWFKPIATSGRYAAGFNTTATLTGTKLLSSAGVGSWLLTLADGDLSSNLVKRLLVNPLGVATVTTNTYKLTLKVTPTTGKFTGSFVPPATSKPVSFSGLFLQGSENDGGGFFLGPATSGAVTLTP